MLQIKQKGFTLIEILLSLGILALGLSGILTLFPVGLDAGQKAIQDTTSTLIAESLMDVLRASILQKHPDGELPFVFDGLTSSSTNHNHYYYHYISDNNSNITPHYETISGTCGSGGLTTYNSDTDEHSLQQYSYQVNITHSSNPNQKHLYDVQITILRNSRAIRNFYSQIMIPEPN